MTIAIQSRVAVHGLVDFIVFIQFILCVDSMHVVEPEVQDVVAA